VVIHIPLPYVDTKRNNIAKHDIARQGLKDFRSRRQR